MCQDSFIPIGSCYDFASMEELLAIRNYFERRRAIRRQVYYNECSPITTNEGHIHGPGSKKCWCNPIIYQSARGTEIVHNLIVPLNAS